MSHPMPENAYDDLQTLVGLAFAKARGELSDRDYALRAAAPGVRVDFFSERPESPYWGSLEPFSERNPKYQRLIDAPALRARADHLERMAEYDFAEAAGPSDEERALEAQLRAHPQRDPAADRWMLARAAASRAASEERSAREAAAEQPASAPRDALGRTFAHRAVQDDARLTQASRRGLRDTDRLIALRRARGQSHAEGAAYAEDDFDAPPQSDPVREAHKRLADEDNDFMRRRGHCGDPVGHRHAAIDLCLDDQECRRLGVDFGAMAEGDDDIPFDHDSRPETLEEIDARTDVPGDEGEAMHNYWAQRGEGGYGGYGGDLPPDLRHRHRGYAEGEDGPRGQLRRVAARREALGSAYRRQARGQEAGGQPGTFARQRARGTHEEAAALRSRGRAYYGQDFAEGDEPDLTPEEQEDAAERSYQRMNRDYLEGGAGSKSNWDYDAEEEHGGRKPRPEYSRRHPRDTDADDLSSPADLYAEGGDNNYGPPRLDGDERADDEWADARDNYLRAYCGVGDIVKAGRDLKARAQDARARDARHGHEEDFSEQGVDLFTVPPRREFLKGYGEEDRKAREEFDAEARSQPPPASAYDAVGDSRGFVPQAGKDFVDERNVRRGRRYQGQDALEPGRYPPPPPPGSYRGDRPPR